MKEEKNKKESYFTHMIGWVIAIFAYFFFLDWWSKKGKDKKYYKNVLFNDTYQVDPKTFAKWIEYFCADIIPIEDYKRKRKLSENLIESIKERLGVPDEEIGVMSKERMAEYTESDYEVLRGMVLDFPDACGITDVQYNTLNTYPPNLVRKVVLMME